MATVEELLGFDEICYLQDAYTESSETNETSGEIVGKILCAFPDGLKNAFPYSSKENLRRVLNDLDRSESFENYIISGMFYVYQNPEANGNSGYKPVNRVSFDTYVCKKPRETKCEKQNMIKPMDSLIFHATVRGSDLSSEPGAVQYLPGCSGELWRLQIPAKKKYEPIAFEKGISCLEKI